MDCEQKRVVAGIVSRQGGKDAGDEFSVNKVSTGHYAVSFRPGFKTLYGVTVTQIYPDDGDTRDNAVIVSLNNNDMLVKTGNSNGSANDRAFSFVAIGLGVGKIAADN